MVARLVDCSIAFEKGRERRCLCDDLEMECDSSEDFEVEWMREVSRIDGWVYTWVS